MSRAIADATMIGRQGIIRGPLTRSGGRAPRQPAKAAKPADRSMARRVILTSKG